jgi:hypothetical protein
MTAKSSPNPGCIRGPCLGRDCLVASDVSQLIRGTENMVLNAACQVPARFPPGRYQNLVRFLQPSKASSSLPAGFRRLGGLRVRTEAPEPAPSCTSKTNGVRRFRQRLCPNLYMEGDRCGGNEVESISPPGSCRQLEQIEGAAVGGSLTCIRDSEQSHMEYRSTCRRCRRCREMQVGGGAGTLKSENGRTEFGVVEIARIGLRRRPRVHAPCWHMAVLSILRIGAPLDKSNWRFRRLPPVVAPLYPWTGDYE